MCKSTPDAIVGNPGAILFHYCWRKFADSNPWFTMMPRCNLLRKLNWKQAIWSQSIKKYFPRCFEIAHSLFKISSKLKNSHIPVYRYVSLRSALQKAYPNATLHGIAKTTVYRHICNSGKTLYIKGWSL